MLSYVGLKHARRNKQNSITENKTKHEPETKKTKQNKKTVRISSLNSKGMLLLLLIVMTETVTLSKAVRIVPPTTQAPPSGGASGSGVGVGGSTMTGTGTDSWVDPLACSSIGSCSSDYEVGAHHSSSSPQANPTNKSSAVPGITTVVGAHHHHRNDNDNKPKIQHNVVAPAVVTTYTIPRGGDVVADTVTAATASVVAAGTAAMAASTTTMPFNIPNTGWKLIFQVVLTTLNVFCWLVPLQMKSFGENKLVLSLANAFSGGVFLSLAFGHLIPECVAGFTSLASSSSTTTPTLNPATPYMLVLSGYLLIFFVEKVAFDADGILHELEHGGGNGNTKAVPNHTSNAKAKSKHHPQNGKKQDTKVATSSTTNNTTNSGRSAVILLAALAVHSILEMAALGLSDTFKDSAILTISIALHQPAESIALLVAFLKSGMPKPQIIMYLSIFSLMGPLGCGLGIIVNEFADPIVDSIMLAIVAGTFVYVGATEVIPEEFEEATNKWKKFTALMTGIVSIFAITQYTMSLEMN